MVKKGQVTILFIVSILIIFIVAIGFFFKDQILDTLREEQIIGIATVPENVEPINNFISNCINIVGEEALSFVGFYGGYYDKANVDKNSRNIPYYLLNKELKIPSKSFIQNSLNSYMNKNLKSCTEDFVDFNNSFSFTEGEVFTKTKILKSKVNFYVKYPVKLTKDDNIYQLKFFNVDIKNNLNEIHNAIVYVLNKQKIHSDICLNCIYDIAVQNNLSVQIYNPVLGEAEYIFIDNDLRIFDDKPYKFIIALRFKDE